MIAKCSNDIRKVLASAVANAQHNDEQDPEELFVKACFADEGPTLKRFTPRARGRGNRINKRTCHITIVVGRLDEATSRDRSGPRSQAHRRRSPASRCRWHERQPQGPRRAQPPASCRSKGRACRACPRSRRVRPGSGRRLGVHGELPTGGHAPLDDGGQPEGYEIKGNADSMLYHLPGTPFYDRTIAEVWFDTAENAEAAGYQLPEQHETQRRQTQIARAEARRARRGEPNK